MKRLLLLLSVVFLSLSMSGQNLKGQYHLTDGEDEYRFFVKIRPEAVIDIEANKVRSFCRSSQSGLNEVLDKLNEYNFVQLLDFDNEERSILRSGKKLRSAKNNFDKSEFSGLLQMQGSEYMDKYELLALAEELEKYDMVEYCDISPVTPPLPPAMAVMTEFTQNETSTDSAIPAPSVGSITPDFEGRQSYLFGYKNKDIYGIYIDYAWSLGITGQGIKIADIEWGWTYTHEDFVGQNVIDGLTTTNHGSDSHGTAVMGEMYAARNGYGVTGGVYGADAFYGFSEIPLGREKAIAMAMDVLEPGDVMVYEMQRGGYGNDSYVPADYTPTVWDLTKNATEAGIIVVAAAGNGTVNLDGTNYAPYRDRGDNGSILVSAATMNKRERCYFTTYGSMVKICGIGDWTITSTGYNDLFDNGINVGYTSSFSGTSSSTPIVAAAAVAIQSYAKNKLGYILSSTEMRELLYTTGTPAKGSWGSLVPRLPNVKNAIKELDSNALNNKRTLTVNNGIGSGFYTPGEKVTIKAGFVHNDSIFSHWEITQGSLALENATTSTTSFNMPSTDVTITQRYKYKKQTQCTISLSRSTYAVGEEMTINFWNNTGINTEVEFFLVSELGEKTPLGKEGFRNRKLKVTIPASIQPDLSYLILGEFVVDGQTMSGTSKPFIATYPNTDYYIIPQSETSIHSVSSEQTSKKATYTLDGDPLTYWSSGEEDDYPHEIVFKLNTTHKVAGLIYLPLQVTGEMVKEYEIYTSLDGETWGTAVASGSCEYGYTENEILFSTAPEAQYVKFKVLSNIAETQTGAIAEILVLGKRDVKLPTATITLTRPYYKQGEEITVRLASNPAHPVNVYLIQNETEYKLGEMDLTTASREFVSKIPADCPPGAYRIAVEFTNVDNFRRSSSTITIKKYDRDYQVVPRKRTKIHSYDSYDGRAGSAANAIDANTLTQWQSKKTDTPHYIVLQTDSIYEFTGLIYLPSQNSDNGRIGNYEIYTTLDPKVWPETPVMSGTWNGGNVEEVVSFGEIVRGQYVKLVAVSDVKGLGYATVSELLLLHTNTSESSIDQPTKNSNIAIYPNPAEGFIYIKGATENEIVKIISISGVLVSETKIENGKPIDVSHLPQGVYLVKVGDVVKKLIKR